MREAIPWALGRRGTVTMKPVRWTGSVFAGIGRKR
jgi:2-polyprenyl-6-hydroxyphenyl methylase/3-demethylubiquinone-9 3-methyltransferase